MKADPAVLPPVPGASRDSHTNMNQIQMNTVMLSEAAMDSPTFRATTNYFDSRVRYLDEWINDTTLYLQNKYKPALADFKKIQNSLLQQLLPNPNMVANGMLINQAFTPTLIDSFNKDFDHLASNLLSIVLGDEVACNKFTSMLAKLKKDSIVPYMDRKNTFDYFQQKFDSHNSKYSAIESSRSVPGSSSSDVSSNASNSALGNRLVDVDPAVLRDEHLKLFESRKEYLKASLDLVGAMSTLKFRLDKVLVDIIDELISKNTVTINDDSMNVDGIEIGRRTIDLSPNISNYLKDYKRWVSEVIEASQVLENNMEKTIIATYTRTVKASGPSKDLQDYNKSIAEKAIEHIVGPKLGTPQKNIAPSTMPSKSGWLYMKTYSSSMPRKEMWVRRWCFVQGTIFGMFSLSPSKTFVEESDKFGIFLTSIKYLPNYSRNFCFELKIIGKDNPESDVLERSSDIDIIFQAEDLKELKSWIMTFHNSKKYIMSQDQKGLQYEVAFKRFSPQYLEFASRANTTMDRLLTSDDNDTLSSKSGSRNLRESLTKFLSSEELKIVKDHKSYLFEFIGTPIATEETRLALLSNLLTSDHSFPNAILANLWGMTSWNDLSHLLTDDTEKTSILKTLPAINDSLNDIGYPNYYSRSLKIADVQFRSIFYSNNRYSYDIPKQFLLLRFGSIWQPNKKQKFAAICFASKDYFHVYMNCHGFTYAGRMNFDDVADVEFSKKSETIHIIRHDGIKYDLHAFFTDAKSVTTKLKFLIENRLSEFPKNEGEVLVKFKQIDREFAQKSTNEKLKSFIGSGNINNTQENQSLAKLNSSLWTIDGSLIDLLKRRADLQKEYSASYKYSYAIPCKGLLHLLFGQKSDAFPRALFLARKGSDYNVTQYWTQREMEDKTTELVRKIQFQINRTSSFIHESAQSREEYLAQQIVVEQKMIKMIDNTYYEIDQDPIMVTFPNSRPTKISLKFIISERYDHDMDAASRLMLSTNHSDFMTYYKIEFIEDIEHEDKVVENLTLWEQIILGWTCKSTKYEFQLMKDVIQSYLDKIGNHGKLAKAMKIGGKLGISNTIERHGTDDKMVAESDQLVEKKSEKEEEKKSVDAPKCICINYTFSLLLKVLVKVFVFRVTNLFFFFFRIFITLVQLGGKTLQQINRLLLAGLAISIIFNGFLLGRSTINYWSVKRAEKSFKSHMESPHNTNMQRALFVKDLDLLTDHLVNGYDNPVYKKFNEENFNDQLNNFKYKDTRQEIAIRRNELLVELKILQNMEKELVKGDYRQFLINELNQCETVAIQLPDVWENDENLLEYCHLAREEFGNMLSL